MTYPRRRSLHATRTQETPIEVDVACALWVGVGGLTLLVWCVLGFLRDDVLYEARKGLDVTKADLSWVELKVNLVLAVLPVVALLVMWLAVRMKAGRRWARAALLLVAVVFVLRFPSLQGNWVAFVLLVVVAGATVLMYARGANRYFHAVRTATR
ncbi:hypothetical protein [Streptoalloteichus hindustanus]|uniref:Uncharacterized protein n=1 Tax=Streptoalloteichus hindustanus TaxID=2017 RepID=A0A1M5Q886_STRHI|nr:hypothetical protein [Streptoalloteichus hindustanus]SHH10198.1 hypothetical protein SAMN05444320_12231 [Streptoalloteichus hindustanus]